MNKMIEDTVKGCLACQVAENLRCSITSLEMRKDIGSRLNYNIY